MVLLTIEIVEMTSGIVIEGRDSWWLLLLVESAGVSSLLVKSAGVSLLLVEPAGGGCRCW